MFDFEPLSEDTCTVISVFLSTTHCVSRSARGGAGGGGLGGSEGIGSEGGGDKGGGTAGGVCGDGLGGEAGGGDGFGGSAGGLGGDLMKANSYMLYVKSMTPSRNLISGQSKKDTKPDVYAWPPDRPRSD